MIGRGGILNVAIGSRAIVIDDDADYDIVAAFFDDAQTPVTDVDPFGRTADGR